MSERRGALQTQGGYTKPATMYIEWSSEDKCFRYYDNNEKVQKLINLPLKFLVLDVYATVKGWSDSEQSGIYSNEVKSTTNEILEVKTFTKKTITKGYYKDIKEVIASSGGKFTSSIYAMNENFEIINLQLKGISLKSWMEFTKFGLSRASDEWVTVKKFEEGKKGAVKYSMPVFEFDKSLSNDESNKADQCYRTLKLALSGRNDSRLQNENNENIESEENESIDFE